MLTDKQLKKLFSVFGITCKGIFLKDKLPKKVQNGFYMFNLDSQNDPVNAGQCGTHWTCLVANDRDIFYYDSFGAVPPVEVESFIRTKYSQYGSNNWIIQDLNSEMCGWYCLCFALYIKENQEPRESLLSICNHFINQFGEDNKKNDVACQRIINNVARKRGESFFTRIMHLLNYK
jgi:hypothetical protein